nr:nucleotide-sugar uncharacterized transporter 2 isoform X2 [Ziziphus jujuba var. spinosa]
MGLFDSLLGGEGKKFIKRKDSDAGEAGRALEELRSSLYNDLRTSEGAKRQQQRFCGPVVAMTFNFMVSVGIIMANKLVMGKVGFNYPIFLTLIHYVVAWFLLAIFKALSILPVSPPSKSTPFSSLFSLGVVMSFSSGLANTSLKHNRWLKSLSLLPLLLQNSLSTGKPFLLRRLMWKTTPTTIFFLLALMPWLDPPGILSFKWDVTNSTAVLISAALGFLLQWSGALTLGATSATTHVVLGQFKTCVILLGGYILFNSDPGLVSICGAVLALCGMSIYTSLNLKDQQESLSKQNLSKTKTSAQEVGADSDAKVVVNVV